MRITTTRREASRRTARRPAARAGSVLLIVLVVVVLLSLGVYTFTELMLAEVEATSMYGRDVQTREFANSGIELAAALLGTRSEILDEHFYHLPDLFQGVLLRDADTAHGRGRFSIVAPVENESGTIRFGLIDESGKLNLNWLAKSGLNEQQSRDMLLFLPEMTDEIADAILDWIDKDDKERQFGAEADYYEMLPQPYATGNGPLDSLDELLLVRDVTPALLFGNDANRNGLIDPEEDDGEEVLPLGWSTYLTVISREANRRADGTERINLNDKNLPTLFDQLQEEFDEETAKFVIAYRMGGAKGSGNSSGGSPSGGSLSGGSRSGNSPSGGSRSGNSPSGGSPSGGTPSGGSPSGGSPSGGKQGEQATRGGMDLSSKNNVKINSIYDLIGIEVEATIDGVKTTLESPWSSEPTEMQEYLPVLTDVLSTSSGKFIEGRININQARLEVLLGIPDMTEELADAIVGSMETGSTGEPLSDVLNTRSTTGWLLIEELVDLELMRKLDKYLTNRGDVYRLQVLGYFDEGGPYSRLEAVIDATYQPPKVVFQRDLSELGRGYTNQQLMLGL